MIVQVRDQHSAIFVFGGLDMLKVNNPMYQIYEQYWHEERVILLIHGIFDVQQQGFCIYTLRLCDIFLKINEEVLCVFQTMRVLFLDQDNSFRILTLLRMKMIGEITSIFSLSSMNECNNTFLDVW